MNWIRDHAQAIHGWLAIAFLVFTPYVVLSNLKYSVPYLVFISQYAVVVAHWGGWSAERPTEKENS